MYIPEVVPALLTSLLVLSAAQGGIILLAHGRNRSAEGMFIEKADESGRFASIERVPPAELHPVYQCSDVDVLRLTSQLSDRS
jgi:hypothetical protein